LVRAEIMRVLEVHRIHLRERDELLDVDRPVRLRLERAQLLVGERDVAVLLELVALHELVPLNDPLADRAERLLTDARAALLVQQVERHGPRVCRDVETDRDGDEPEADRPRADRARWHGASFAPGKPSAPGRVKPPSYASIVMRQRPASATTPTTWCPAASAARGMSATPCGSSRTRSGWWRRAIPSSPTRARAQLSGQRTPRRSSVSRATRAPGRRRGDAVRREVVEPRRDREAELADRACGRQ